MQVNYLNDAQELADFIEQANVLTMIDHAGLRVIVAEFAGQDVLAIQGLSDGAIVVYGPEAFDAESGGSVHDHARAIYGTTPADGAPAT